uniref:C-type lectin domain-containing protein n=1 Tax=Acrobeloides nanus TaxID=290746 RepID=A0A914DGI6_9BILA
MALTSFVLFLFIFKIATSNCPQGSLQGIYPSDCYVFNDSPSDYIAAEGSCNDLKGHLVSIPDIFVNSFLAENAYEFLKSIDINGHYWIGLNTVYNSSGWTWTDGTSSNYSNWDKGQPNIVTSACASQSTPAGKWYSEDCNSLKLPYVCKLPSTSSGQSCDSSPQTLSAPTCPPTPTFTLSQNTCPSGWTYYAPSKKCFMVLYKNLTFYDALYQCGQIDFYNGTLASIHSDDENNFVNSLASMHFWPNCTNSWQNDQPSINTWIGLHDPFRM